MHSTHRALTSLRRARRFGCCFLFLYIYIFNMIPTAGTLTHDKVTFSHRAADILSPSVNIVCIPRVTAVESRLHRPPMPHVALERFVATSPGLRLRAPVVPVWDPEPTVSGLLNPENIPDPEARRFLVEDICSTVSSLFGEELGDRCAIRIHTLQPQTAIRTHTLQPQNPAPVAAPHPRLKT